MSNQSQELFLMFQNNLNKHEKLSRDMVFGVAKETFDKFFVSPSVSAKAGGAGAGASAKVKEAKKPKEPKTPSGPPTQWHKITSSKELGVTVFFKSDYDEMKAVTGNINYFTAIKQLKAKYENTPKWQEYRAWVAEHHPAPETIQESKQDTATAASATVVATSATVSDV